MDRGSLKPISGMIDMNGSIREGQGILCVDAIPVGGELENAAPDFNAAV